MGDVPTLIVRVEGNEFLVSGQDLKEVIPQPYKYGPLGVEDDK